MRSLHQRLGIFLRQTRQRDFEIGREDKSAFVAPNQADMGNHFVLSQGQFARAREGLESGSETGGVAAGKKLLGIGALTARPTHFLGSHEHEIERGVIRGHSPFATVKRGGMGCIEPSRGLRIVNAWSCENSLGSHQLDPLRVHRTSLGRAAGLAGPSAESLPLL